MKKLILILVLFLFAFTAKSNTLDDVKNRGYLICGISENLTGFATPNDKGMWTGFDVDMCRAVAAAVFGDFNKVEFITTTSRSRFPILASGEIDLLARNTTWTFSRDANLGFEYAGINFYDGQGFMVSKSLGIDSVKDLEGATVCIEIGSTKEFNINNFFLKNNISFKALLVEIDDDAVENYLAGRCDVYTNLISELAVLRIKIPKPSNHIILPEIISKEPLGPLVRHGDNEWGDIVRWSLNTMIIAEELGLTSENVDEHFESNNNEVLRLLGVVGSYGDMLELDYNWAYNIIKQVGDYSSVFNRNIGPDTALGLERGLNALWSKGGILYAPPFK